MAEDSSSSSRSSTRSTLDPTSEGVAVVSPKNRQIGDETSASSGAQRPPRPSEDHLQSDSRRSSSHSDQAPGSAPTPLPAKKTAPSIAPPVPAPPPPPAAAAAKQQRQQSSSNHQGTSSRHVLPTVIDAGIRLVPALFQHCELNDIIALVSSMLDRLLEYNDSLPPAESLTRFHSKAAPNISPSAYLTRITTFINVDPCILIILLYYIDRLSGYLTINSLTLHRFLISAICCGSKALSDSFATNSRYAKVGGVELVEMNALEREFLIAIDWRLATSGAMLEQYWRSLVEAHPAYRLAPLTVGPALQRYYTLPPPPPSQAPHHSSQQPVQPTQIPSSTTTDTDTGTGTGTAAAPAFSSGSSRPIKRAKSRLGGEGGDGCGNDGEREIQSRVGV